LQKFVRISGAGDVAQPCGGEVERGLTIRERAHDAGGSLLLAWLR
jgi:hypothetical protein